jgi:hypothetical protein
VDRLVDTHILLGREQKRSLRALAADQDSSLSVIVRDAVDHYFETVAGPTPDRLRLAARAAVGRLEPSDDSVADDRLQPPGGGVADDRLQPPGGGVADDAVRGEGGGGLWE